MNNFQWLVSRKSTYSTVLFYHQGFNKPLRERGNYEQYNDYLDKLQQENKNAIGGLGGHAAFRKDEDAALRQRIAERPVSASAADAARKGDEGR